MKNASTSAYRENRARFPLQELGKYDGQWVAFSPDGQHIVASGSSIADVASELRSAQKALHGVVLERIEMESGCIALGAAELQ
jgi:hypothetical protein